MFVLKYLFLYFLRFWAWLKLAPGYLYQFIDRHGGKLYIQPSPRRLFNNLIVVCDIRESIQRILYFFGYYEGPETFFTMNLLKRGDRVIDAGANIGYYSLVAANCVGGEGRVYSFEPIPVNYMRLKKHITLNHLEQVVTVNNMGLWDENKELQFSQSQDKHDNFGTFSAGIKEQVAQTFACPVVRLDDYVKQNQIARVDFIKMDVEGAELLALKGAIQTIRRDRPTVLLEICRYTCERFGYQADDIWELLRPLGYRMHLIGKSSGKSRDLKDLSGVEQANVVFYQGELPAVLRGQWSLKELRRTLF